MASEHFLYDDSALILPPPIQLLHQPIPALLTNQLLESASEPWLQLTQKTTEMTPETELPVYLTLKPTLQQLQEMTKPTKTAWPKQRKKIRKISKKQQENKAEHSPE